MIRRYLLIRLFGPAVPAVALVDVIAALIALLLVMASGLLQRAIKALFSGAGFPVDAVGSFLAGAVASAVTAIRDATTYAVEPIAYFVAGPVVALWRWMAQLGITGAAITGLAGEALHVAQGAATSGAGALASVAGALTTEIDQVANTAHSWVDGAVSLAHAEVVSAYNDLAYDIRAVEGYAAHLYNLAVADVGAAYHDLAYDLNVNVSRITDLITSDIGAVSTDVATAVAGALAAAEAYTAVAVSDVLDQADTTAEDLVNTGIAALDQAAHDLVIGPWAELLPYLEGIANALPADIAKALGLPGVIAEAVPDSIPGILALVVPAIAAIGVETLDCVIPQCRSLGNLTKLLQQLEGDAFFALLIALLAELAAHPGQVADDIESTLAGPVTDTADALRSLIGL